MKLIKSSTPSSPRHRPDAVCASTTAAEEAQTAAESLLTFDLQREVRVDGRVRSGRGQRSRRDGWTSCLSADVGVGGGGELRLRTPHRRGAGGGVEVGGRRGGVDLRQRRRGGEARG